jgi:hypothetical protein
VTFLVLDIEGSSRQKGEGQRMTFLGFMSSFQREWWKEEGSGLPASADFSNAKCHILGYYVMYPNNYTFISEEI